ncbi:hypothetical protein [Streptomyces sp. NPDC126514]|uniref:hypothetical protein n=1 Tax=Streptomyces sp. NPDC126514 TaxID=3155210 RepID=UPI0033229C4C
MTGWTTGPNSKRRLLAILRRSIAHAQRRNKVARNAVLLAHRTEGAPWLAE